MYCEKCGHKCPKRSEFCPSCGRGLSTKKRSKKGAKPIRIVIAVVVAVLCIGLTISYAVWRSGFFWERMIYEDWLSGESTVEQATANAVSFEVEQVAKNQIQVTVCSSDICDDLLVWMESTSDADFSDSAIEEKICQLLSESIPVEKTVIMSCNMDVSNPKIYYTQEFSELMSCGLNRFYAEVSQRILEELGGVSE